MLTFAFKFEMGEHIKKLKYISHRKLIDPMYLLVKMISVLFFGVGWLTNRANMRSPLVLIEAGIKGWETLFFSELLHSSPEYFGSERVRTSSIDKVQPYLQQFYLAIKTSKPTHFFSIQTSDTTWSQMSRLKPLGLPRRQVLKMESKSWSRAILC